MSEILFRGKREYTGEWIEGYLYITQRGQYEISRYSKSYDCERYTSVVIPSTVGQYTGLTDKNGKKVTFHIVVSNPPYIAEREKAQMDASVLDYEPHSALFVPDQDPLLFYRRIAELRLAPYLYFEVNEAYAQQTADILQSMGYQDIILKNDSYGKPRILAARTDLTR